MVTLVTLALSLVVVSIEIRERNPALDGLPVPEDGPPRRGDLTYIPPPAPLQPTALRLEVDQPLREFGRSDYRLAAGGSDRVFCFSPDGSRLAGAKGREVKVWSFPSGRLVCRCSAIEYATELAFDPTGEELIALRQVRAGDRTRCVLDRYGLPDGSFIRRAELQGFLVEGSIQYSFSNDTRMLLTNVKREQTLAWSTQTGAKVAEPSLPPLVGNCRCRVVGDTLLAWGYHVVARYDLTTGNELSLHRVARQLLGVLPNRPGDLMAAYSTADEAIVFFRPDTLERVGASIPANEKSWRPENATLSDDGKRLVYWDESGTSLYDRNVVVYDVASGEWVASFPAPEDSSLAGPMISPSGEWLLYAAGKTAFTPVATASGEPVRVPAVHRTAITRVEFTPDGRTLVAIDRTRQQLWNVLDGTVGVSLGPRLRSSTRTVVDDRWAFGWDHATGLCLLDLKTGDTVRRYDDVVGDPRLLFPATTDGRTFVSSGMDGDDRLVRRFDIETGRVLQERRDPLGPRPGRGRGRRLDEFAPLGFVFGGSHVARIEPGLYEPRPAGTAPRRPEIVLEDWAERRVTHRFAVPSPNVGRLEVTPDGRFLMACVRFERKARWFPRATRRKTEILVWEVESGAERCRIELDRDRSYTAYSAAVLSNDGRRIATVGPDGEIEFYDARGGRRLGSRQPASLVSTMAFSADGSRLATGHNDGALNLWDTTDVALKRYRREAH